MTEGDKTMGYWFDRSATASNSSATPPDMPPAHVPSAHEESGRTVRIPPHPNPCFRSSRAVSGPDVAQPEPDTRRSGASCHGHRRTDPQGVAPMWAVCAPPQHHGSPAVHPDQPGFAIQSVDKPYSAAKRGRRRCISAPSSKSKFSPMSGSASGSPRSLWRSSRRSQNSSYWPMTRS